MTQVAEQQRYPDDEIDLRELFLALWHGKWLIFVATFVFAATGALYALYKPNIYLSTVLLAPASEENTGISSVGGGLGGLASLAGISLGNSGSNQTVIGQEILKSRKFQTEFIREHNLAPLLIAVEGWERETNELIYDLDLYDPTEKQWQQSTKGRSQTPTDWELVEKFREEHFSISESKDTGMISINLKHYSPIVAKNWADWLVQDINSYLREQDVKEAELRVEYLEKKLKTTQVAEMQKIFYQLIENETRTIMLANAQKEYAFKTIDPAVSAEEKHEPKRSVIVAIFTLLGGAIGVAGALAHNYFSKKQPIREH